LEFSVLLPLLLLLLGGWKSPRRVAPSSGSHCSGVEWSTAATGKMDGCNGSEDMPKKHGQPEARQQRGIICCHPHRGGEGGWQNLMTAKLDFEGACAQKQQQNKANKNSRAAEK